MAVNIKLFLAWLVLFLHAFQALVKAFGFLFVYLKYRALMVDPAAAMPHSPDLVKSIREIGPIKVDQVCIGSCTNSSYLDLMRVAAILKGKSIAPEVSLTISPGSRQVMTMLAQNGALADIISAGARILECGCGPCIGMGQAPRTDAVSVRTFNRNFYGRTGTYSAGVYLTSVETAAATALTGVLTDPRDIGLSGDALNVDMPKAFLINDNLISPPDAAGETEVVRGPNIKPFPQGKALEDTVAGEVLLKMEDNITTDHISPAGAKLLPYRSNIPYLSDFCLAPVDPEFPSRAKQKGGGFLVAGHNYGQGSSREHAALVPLYLGIRGVIAKSFARIHMANLVNSGILPLVFEDEAVYDKIDQGDVLEISNAPDKVDGKISFTADNKTKGFSFAVALDVSKRLKAVLKDGGLLNHTRKGSNG